MSFRRLALLTIGSWLLATASAAAWDGTVVLDSGPFEGRHYRLHVPETCAPTTPRPLLLILHGGGLAEDDGPSDIRTIVGAEAPGDRRGCGLVIAYPRGLTIFGEPASPLTCVADWWACAVWNFGPELRAPQDDMGFLSAVIEDVAERTPIRRDRVSAAGFSAGGFLLHRALCEGRASSFYSMLTAAATMAMGELGRCVQPQPRIPLSILAGTADPTIRYDGARVATGQITTTALSVEALWWLHQALRGARFEPGDVGGATGSDLWRWNTEALVATVTHSGGHSWPGSGARTNCCGGPISAELDATVLLLDMACAGGAC